MIVTVCKPSSPDERAGASQSSSRVSLLRQAQLSRRFSKRPLCTLLLCGAILGVPRCRNSANCAARLAAAALFDSYWEGIADASQDRAVVEPPSRLTASFSTPSSDIVVPPLLRIAATHAFDGILFLRACRATWPSMLDLQAAPSAVVARGLAATSVSVSTSLGSESSLTLRVEASSSQLGIGGAPPLLRRAATTALPVLLLLLASGGAWLPLSGVVQLELLILFLRKPFMPR
mmetsp:Transcript_742/g.1763  ORF Transcript_742/g.1763 Transcript_742/m.1763 type:complete len:233 (-) Transcript_742:254-952(-)